MTSLPTFLDNLTGFEGSWVGGSSVSEISDMFSPNAALEIKVKSNWNFLIELIEQN